MVQHWHYESSTNNPNLKERPEHVCLSNILDIDWDEFYSSSETLEKSKKYEFELQEFYEQRGHDKHFFIGDTISYYIFLSLDIKDNRKIDRELMEYLDLEIKEIYNFFIKLGKKEETYIYVQSQITCDGEQLYRRVKNV